MVEFLLYLTAFLLGTIFGSYMVLTIVASRIRLL